MKIALVHLPLWPVSTPPLGIAYISAILKRRCHQVEIFDENIETWSALNNSNLWDLDKMSEAKSGNIFFNKILNVIKPFISQLNKKLVIEEFDAVGFSIKELNLLSTLYCIRMLKALKPEIKIFCGGPEVYYDNKLLMDFVASGLISSAIFGEAEETVDELFSCWEKELPIDHILGMATPSTDFKQKRLAKRPPVNFANLPLPDFSNYKLNLYQLQELPIMMSRGCVATCTYCTEFVTWKSYKIRTANDVYNEIKSHVENYKVKNFYFCDSLINGNHEMLKHLVELINSQNLNINWTAFARVDDRLTLDLLMQMRKSGCRELRFGLESGSDKVLKLMNKNNTIKTAYQTIKSSALAEIDIQGLFIVGFPGETPHDFFLTQKLIYENRKRFKKIYISILGLDPVSPMSGNPASYGIKTNADGTVFFDQYKEWYSVDGALDPAERFNRFNRMQFFLDALKLNWGPVPRTSLESSAFWFRVKKNLGNQFELSRFYYNYYLIRLIGRDKLSSKNISINN